MTHLIRSILAGALIGAGIFFMPFGFPFIFLFLLLIVFFRSRRRRFYGWRHHHHFQHNVIPIDGDPYYRAANPNAPETKITIH